ncbi:MAG: EF-hand domain-containing protein, partial [Gemmataceae bacterium]|nr:EF-hand domain-containing protein [Gemmataceae bacterium]
MRRRIVTGLCFAAGLVAAASLAGAQPPEGGGKDDKAEAKKGPPKGPPKGGPLEVWIARMMVQDADGDGKLSKDEVTDARLKRLFDEADADKDGKLTRDELADLFGLHGPAALLGPDGFPKGPPGGGMMFGPPQPGQVMPPFLREALKLSDEQKKQLDDLQKEVDTKLGKILTDDQKKQLDDMKK